ncbi:regulator of chromosome condensation 1/beta-lactamase-inhibitor protein II [Chiua virens]|nr:regulator of chromosome condensation 1/beta-lactamase-inhibitor protein II [Chiua virens]
MIRNVLATSSRRLQAIHFGVARAGTPTRTPWLMPRRSAAVVATTTAMFLWYLSGNPVHNDTAQNSPTSSLHSSRTNISSTGVDEHGVLCPVVWGSNKSNLLDPYLPGIETFQTPVNVKWLENVALRDMVLHERHAALVDVRGDVYQWGDGFFGSKSDARAPKVTLRGKVGCMVSLVQTFMFICFSLQNIIKVQLTDSRVYALSASGRIYVFAANEERQKLPATHSSSTAFSWAAGCTSREQGSIDFVEIFPKEKLKWSETFISIAAGNDHLLALTSDGRTYAHPVNKNANSHGQFGLRKVEIPVHSGPKDVLDHSRMTVELVPGSLVKPYMNASHTSRELPPTNTTSADLNAIDDNHVVFSDALFEIPSLRGVKVAQIAAGGRSSFVNTSSGRVLGWGANGHGQIGLGPGITLDTITVPTEIDVT